MSSVFSFFFFYNNVLFIRYDSGAFMDMRWRGYDTDVFFVSLLVGDNRLSKYLPTGYHVPRLLTDE